MNTVDPRLKNGIDFEDVNSLLHIMIRNKDTDVFLILPLPFYGTSSIRKQIYSGYLPETFSTCCRFMEHLPSENGSKHRFIPETSRRRFPPRILYLSQTSFMFNTSCSQLLLNYEYILISKLQHNNTVKFCLFWLHLGSRSTIKV